MNAQQTSNSKSPDAPNNNTPNSNIAPWSTSQIGMTNNNQGNFETKSQSQTQPKEIKGRIIPDDKVSMPDEQFDIDNKSIKKAKPMLIVLIINLIIIFGLTIFIIFPRDNGNFLSKYISHDTQPTPTKGQIKFRKPSPYPTKSITENKDLLEQINSLLTSNLFQFDSQTTVDDRGCLLTVNITGKIDGKNMYLKTQSGLAQPINTACTESNIVDIFNEVIWYEKQIYYRQYRNQPFRIYISESNMAIPENPITYLQKLLANYQNLIIDSKKSNQDIIIATIDNNQKQGTYQFRSNNGNITNIIYNGTDSYEDDQVKVQTTVRFNYQIDQIKSPDDIQ